MIRLPRRSDRIVAKALLVLAVSPLLLLLVMWILHDASRAQLTWAFRGPSCPRPTEGPALEQSGGADGRMSWHRLTPTGLAMDPWGEPYYVEDPNDHHARVCSAGPNGAFEFGAGDDVQVAGFFFFGTGHLLIFLAVGGLLSSLGGALLYLAWRLALLPRSPRVGVEFARAAVISLPIVLCSVCLVFAIGLDDLAQQVSFAFVSPRVAVVFTTASVVYMVVVFLRAVPARGLPSFDHEG